MRRDGSVSATFISIQLLRDYNVSDLCPCVSLTCKCVNASIGSVEHCMLCGESWLAIKDLKHTIPMQFSRLGIQCAF